MGHGSAALRGMLILCALAASLPPLPAKDNPGMPTHYLAFQIFEGSPPGSRELSPPPSKAEIRALAQDVVTEVGMTGDGRHKLAFVVGPLAFDHTDSQLRQMIHDAFDIARDLDIAVGFHIDDSMFWASRTGLWGDPLNVEWLDWEGTPTTGRRIDWGSQPAKLAPQMCFNSPAILAEVTRLAKEVMGKAIMEEVEALARQGRAGLFAGVIVGWETQLGQDFDSGRQTGYNALSRKGFSRSHPPPDLDAEREKLVQAFIGLWAEGFAGAGLDPQKIYSHTAQLSRTAYDAQPAPKPSYSAQNHFAPPEVAFGASHNPGFSTYPQPGQMSQLYEALRAHGSPPWASSEGSTVNPATQESVLAMETYLAWMFNHGATLVTIFGWGVGTKAANPFWKAAASAESLEAYRKFLGGQALAEDATDSTIDLSGRLPGKIHRMQAELPGWLGRHPLAQAELEALMRQLDLELKAGDLQKAEATVEAILGRMGI